MMVEVVTPTEKPKGADYEQRQLSQNDIFSLAGSNSQLDYLNMLEQKVNLH